MVVEESMLPGVGKKFKIELENDKHLIIIIHNTGKRDVYLDDDPDEDNKKLFQLNDSQSRIIGSILEGAFYHPSVSQKSSTQIDETTTMDWYTLKKDSRLIGRSLKNINQDSEIEIQVIACKAEDQNTTSSDPETTLQEGDLIIGVGSRKQHEDFKNYLGG